jgi:hypothetical protein
MGGSAHWKAFTYTGQHNAEKYRHTSMLPVLSEPMNPEFKWSKTIHTLDCAATEISTWNCMEYKYLKTHKHIS